MTSDAHDEQKKAVCVVCGMPLRAVYVNGQPYWECPLHGSRGVVREGK